MPKIPPARTALAVVAVLTALLAPASAQATGPAAVTVRVVAHDGSALVPQTAVTTNATAVKPDGQHPCSGTSAGGALWDATGGQWGGNWSSSFSEYFLSSIKGIDYGSSPDLFWSFWVNDQSASVGLCEQELNAGDRVLFFPQCYTTGPDCTSASSPDHLLTETAPSSPVVEQGAPVSVTVGSIATANGQPDGSLPAGVAVTAGSQSTAPDGHGVATFTFGAPGTYTIAAGAPDSVPSAPQTVCVHNGNDGNCGTTAPGSTTTPSTAAAPQQTVTAAPAPYTGPFAVVAQALNLIDGHVYPAGHAPRVLGGRVSSKSPIVAVLIRLRRSRHGRCQAYSGRRERFFAAPCGQDWYFKVGSGPTFSYLLPQALGPGRYVFDILAYDAAGNRVAPARGTSHVLFYVG